MYNSILASDPLSAAIVVGVALAAALPAYQILRRAKPGRARSAVAYLLGFCAGLLATAAFAGALEPRGAEDTSVAFIGLVASFVGPFVGMVHAKLNRLGGRKPSRRASGLRVGYPR